jgi:hypothetical protein
MFVKLQNIDCSGEYLRVLHRNLSENFSSGNIKQETKHFRKESRVFQKKSGLSSLPAQHHSSL